VGYEAMPLERLTMLVVPREADATLVIPRLEVPRVVERPEAFAIRAWGETEDPVAIVADLVGPVGRAAIGPRTWAQFLVALQGEMPDTTFATTAPVIGPLRAVKDTEEIAALRIAAEAVDRIAADLQAGDIPLVGRTEAEVSADLGRRILAEGHHRVNFAIVAAWAPGTSCEAVDDATRKVIADAGYGERFVHRTGHGIGVEEHEDPYIVDGNATPLAPGHAYSVEPGIYLPGRFGLRLEDIVVTTPDGPAPLNHAVHDLVAVDA
jgi:Xaa-Pro aminopeptidase